ncbi:MAG: glycosyltransferase [Candidatus Sericytochromatia bacterium]|nr:glycosyltransferase [Candidatus Sericytochromatia bacterium]
MSTHYEHLLQDLERADTRAQTRLNPDQKLSLCMIVKNEEAYLADCLNSVQGVVDEIIVVDTGSSDRTVEIARQYGARVFFKDWEDDFSAARNESLKHATGDWVLVMDADERIPEGMGNNLRALLIPTEQPLSYLTYIKNYMREQDEASVLGHYVVRLFRKTPETFFFGVIHEQLYPNWGAVTIPESSFYLIHLGYGKLEHKANKIETRNKPLILKALEQSKDNNPQMYSFYAYYMGGTTNDPQEVKKWMLESIRSCPEPERADHISVAYIDGLRAIYHLGEYEEGLQLAEQALHQLPSMRSYADLWDFYGLMLLASERPLDAISAFEKALEHGDVNKEGTMFFAARSKRIGGWGTMMNLGLAHAMAKQQAEAESWFRQALENYPEADKTMLVNRIDKIMGDPRLTATYFEELVERTPEASQYDLKVLSNAYLKQEKPFEALMLQHQLHGTEKIEAAALKLGKTYLQHQRFDLVQKTCEGLLSLVPECFAAQLLLWQAELLQQAQQPDVVDLTAWQQKAQTSADYLLLGEFCLMFALLDAAAESFEQAYKNGAELYQVQLYQALVAQEKQALEEAQRLLIELIELYPERTEAYTQLGNLQLALGGFAAAETQFRQIKALESEVPSWYAYYGLGIALAGQERFEEAQAELEEARRLAPGQTGPAYMLEMIANAQAEAEESASEASS